MNDNRQPALPGGRDMSAENPRGNVARGLVIMLIEPGFADADAFRVARQREQAILRHFGFFMRMMRMCPNRAKDFLIGFGEQADRTKSFRAGRNGDHPLEPGGAGAFDHGIALGGEIRKIEMAMTVDQHARPLGSKPSSASMYRGKTGSGGGKSVPATRPCAISALANFRAFAGPLQTPRSFSIEAGKNGCAMIATMRTTSAVT